MATGFPIRAKYTNGDATGFTEYQTSDTLKILDSAGNTSILLESSNDTAATEWSALDIYRNAANPLDGDVLGSITFSGEDSAGNKTSYAGLRTLTTDVTSDTEDGTLQLQVMKDGTLTPIGQIDAAGLTITGTVDATLIGGDAVKDEDTMLSDSATHLATQQSIKAYVDTQIQTEDTIAELNDTAITGTLADNEFLAYDTTTSKWINQTAAEVGLAIGTDVQAYDDTIVVDADIGTTVQAYDEDLAAIAGLTSAANKGIQFTGSGAAAVYTLTTAGKALLDDTDASAQRTTLELGSVATLSSIATTNIAADAVTYAKIQNVSATSRILGRNSAGAGIVEEITPAQVLTMLGAATTAYVDGVAQGLDIKDSVSLATTANLAYTYDGNQTLTNDTTGAISIDGIATTSNMRILVKNQTTNTQNGIYYVTTAGAVGVNLVLTRATDANTGTKLSGGAFTFVEKGTVAAENGYVFTHDGDANFGVTALTVSQFSGAGQIVAGAGIAKSGNTLSANLSGLTTSDIDADGDFFVVVDAAAAQKKLTKSNIKLSGFNDDLVYNNYTHPNSTGNKHIPTGGDVGQFLINDASGSAVWGADNDTVYSHPTHDSDDIDIDTTPLTGATVISDLDFNVTTDSLGHVTDANAAISTRTLTASNIGAATTGKAIAMAIVFG